MLFQPARAIERKNVPGALRFAHQLQRDSQPGLDLRLWISGPAEDGYEPVLDRIIERAEIPVTLGRAATAADAVRGRGSRRVPLHVGGVRQPDRRVDRVPARVRGVPLSRCSRRSSRPASACSRPNSRRRVAKFLAEQPAVRDRYFEANVNRARVSFSLTDLPPTIDETFSGHGWIAW